MRSLRQLFASAGVGMATIEITLDQAEHPCGSKVTGKIVLTGGRAVQQVESIILYLETYSASPRGQSNHLLEAHRLETQFTLLPHAVHSYLFALEIPGQALLTISAPSGLACRLRAVATIQRGVDPGTTIALKVTVNREIQAVQAAVSQLGFKQTAVSTYAANPPPEVTRATYYPPANLRRGIDETVLFIQVEGDRTRGELCFTPNRGGLLERVNALAGVYSHRYPLRFRSEELVSPDGDLSPEGALPRISEIVKFVEAEIAEQHNTLLRPAFAPEGDMLLRPAAGAGGSNPDKLLRPVDEEP